MVVHRCDVTNTAAWTPGFKEEGPYSHSEEGDVRSCLGRRALEEGLVPFALESRAAAVWHGCSDSVGDDTRQVVQGFLK